MEETKVVTPVKNGSTILEGVDGQIDRNFKWK
jgi:hypothetical protein